MSHEMNLTTQAKRRDGVGAAGPPRSVQVEREIRPAHEASQPAN